MPDLLQQADWVRDGDVARPAQTLNEALLRAASAAGGAVTGLRFVDRRERAQHVSWRELAQRAGAVAAALCELGLCPGERAAIVHPTGIAFFDAFFGVLLAGGVPVPLYPPVRLGRLDEYHERTARMLSAVSARVVLSEGQVARLLGEAVLRARPPLGCVDTTSLVDRMRNGPPSRPGALDLALVQFSSGTTAEPRPVALSHRAVLAQARLLHDLLPDRPGLVQSGLSWLPLYHDMGLIGCVFPALLRPADLTLIGPEVFIARPAIWLRALSRYGATVSPAPNFAYALCLDRIRDEELEGVDLSRWRLALNGAETVVAPVLRAFTERFARWGLRPEAMTPVYGLAEAALAVTFSALDRPFGSLRVERAPLETEGQVVTAVTEVTAVTAQGAHRRLSDEHVSLGTPVPGFTLQLRDAHGQVLPEDRVGRLFVRGPSLMSGYLDQPGATAAVLRDGWLDTGDLGFLHQGELYLVGRAKDVLVLRGRNHSPELVEQAVDAVAGVRTGCSVAVSWRPAGAASEELVIFVERSRSHRRPAGELVAACRERVLQAAGIEPREILVLEPGTIPRTSSGKLRRAETLRRHLAGELRAPRAVGPVRLAGALLQGEAALRRARRTREA